MSEHQYYEFRAIDRALDRAAQAALRQVSSRARITTHRFTNHYGWGDFRGDPRQFMERWFDLHLYTANWGTRRLMIRAPERLVAASSLAPFLVDVECLEIWTAGGNVVIDICREEEDPPYDETEDEAWLDALAPLREDLLSGDLRLLYLPWLLSVQDDVVDDDAVEPLAGLGPLTPALEVLADFLHLDPDLVQAASQIGHEAPSASQADVAAVLRATTEAEKVNLLMHVVDGDAHVATELKRRARHQASPAPHRRAAGDLRRLAMEVRKAGERADAERLEAQRRREAQLAERSRRMRLASLEERGDDVWREVETEIERRNASGYDRATSLLSDLQALAGETGEVSAFNRRMEAIRSRHAGKYRFIERIAAIGRV